MRSPEYVCFDDGSIRFVNYFGRALVRFDYKTETALMYSEEPTYLYEKLYLLLLSRSGEWLDRRGIHRVHALGVGVNGKASLFLMPSGGWQINPSALTTFKSRQSHTTFRRYPTSKLSSISIAPFPLRLGISKSQLPEDAPAEYIREFQRERWGTKYLLHADYFKKKINTTPLPLRYLFSGKWINSDNPRIERIGRIKMFLTLMRDCVFGMGLPQIVEFFLSSNPIDLLRKAGIALHRIYVICKLIIKSTPYRILLSRDIAANSRVISRFLSDN